MPKQVRRKSRSLSRTRRRSPTSSKRILNKTFANAHVGDVVTTQVQGQGGHNRNTRIRGFVDDQDYDLGYGTLKNRYSKTHKYILLHDQGETYPYTISADGMSSGGRMYVLGSSG